MFFSGLMGVGVGWERRFWKMFLLVFGVGCVMFWCWRKGFLCWPDVI